MSTQEALAPLLQYFYQPFEAKLEAELEAEVEVDKSEVEILGVFVGMVAAEAIATTIERMVNIFMIGFQHYGIGC